MAITLLVHVTDIRKIPFTIYYRMEQVGIDSPVLLVWPEQFEQTTLFN